MSTVSYTHLQRDEHAAERVNKTDEASEADWENTCLLYTSTRRPICVSTGAECGSPMRMLSRRRRKRSRPSRRMRKRTRADSGTRSSGNCLLYTSSFCGTVNHFLNGTCRGDFLRFPSPCAVCFCGVVFGYGDSLFGGSVGVLLQKGENGSTVKIISQLSGGNGLRPVRGEVGKPSPAFFHGHTCLLYTSSVTV